MTLQCLWVSQQSQSEQKGHHQQRGGVIITGSWLLGKPSLIAKIAKASPTSQVEWSLFIPDCIW